MNEPDRLPPWSSTAECHLIGAAMLDNSFVSELDGRVTPDDFYSERNRILWQVVVDLIRRDVAAEPVSVYDHLKSTGDLERIGGAATIAEIIDRVPTAANWRSHARIIADHATVRRLVRTCAEVVEAGYSGVEDVDAFVEAAEAGVYAVSHRARQSGGQADRSIADLVKASWDRLTTPEERARERAWSTGLSDLDWQTGGGLYPGLLYVFAARPAMGKTSLALNVTVAGAKASGRTALFFTMEMPDDEIVDRVISAEAQADSSIFRRRELDLFDDMSGLEAAAGRIADLGDSLKVRARDELTPAQVRAAGRRESNLGLIVVDYLQLVSPDTMRRGSYKSRNDEVAQITRSLKKTAMQLKVPVILVCQLNRDIMKESRKDKRPRMSDLRDSGAIEQDADVIVFVHRESYFDPRDSNRKQAQLIVAKNRQGDTGTVQVTFEKEQTRFAEREAQPF